MLIAIGIAVIIVVIERSVELAIVSVFDEQVNIQYCFYHLIQSIWPTTYLIYLFSIHTCEEINALN